jgi:putative PEP-CTERM system integral membrane protein
MVKEQSQTSVRRRKAWRGLAYALFWSWNVIFLAFLFLGFAPQLLPEMITAVRGGVIPAPFLAYAVILTAIPVAAVILGLTVLRRSPGRLLTLGYGVEGPLMLVLAIRFFVVREATAAVTLLFSVAGLSMATLLWQILDRNIDARKWGFSHLRVAGLTLLLLAGLYASAWIAFYALPIAAEGWDILTDLVRGMQQNLTHMGWRWIPFWVLGTILAIYTATLFVVMPVAVPILYARAWWRGVRALGAGHGRVRAAGLAVAVLAVCAAGQPTAAAPGVRAAGDATGHAGRGPSAPGPAGGDPRRAAQRVPGPAALRQRGGRGASRERDV